jgi:hypothetical protein
MVVQKTLALARKADENERVIRLMRMQLRELETRTAQFRLKIAAEEAARRGTPQKLKRPRISPRQMQAVAIMKAKPVANYRVLATGVYGEVSAAALNKARMLVKKMKTELVITGGPGHWKVLRPNLGGAPLRSAATTRSP